MFPFGKTFSSTIVYLQSSERGHPHKHKTCDKVYLDSTFNEYIPATFATTHTQAHTNVEASNCLKNYPRRPISESN